MPYIVKVKKQGNVVSEHKVDAPDARAAIAAVKSKLGLKPTVAQLVDGHWVVSHWHGFELQASIDGR